MDFLDRTVGVGKVVKVARPSEGNIFTRMELKVCAIVKKVQQRFALTKKDRCKALVLLKTPIVQMSMAISCTFVVVCSDDR